jgi:vibriolysin
MSAPAGVLRAPGLALSLLATVACGGPWHDDELGPGTAVVRLGDREAAATPGDAAASALAYAAARQHALGLGEGGDFEVRSINPGPRSLHVVRLRQRLGGVPVWGGDLAVRVRGEEVLGLRGALAPGLAAAEAVPRIDREQALAIAKDAHARAAGGSRVRFERARADLVWFPVGEGAARLAWEVELFAEAQAGRPAARPTRLLDARDGQTLLRYDALAKVVHASGLGGNERVDRRWEEALEASPSCGDYRLATPRLETFDMGGRSSGPGSVVAGPIDCIGSRAANDAHGFASVTLDMLAAWMERDSIDGAGAPIRSRVHYGEAYANAFWDGEKVTYGEGGDLFYPLSGDATVVAHEILHGFTEHHASLVFKGQAGALSESFSDVAGVAVSYFLNGRYSTEPGFRIGADVVRGGEGALRDLCEPRRDGRSIDHADDYRPGMFIHAASGVPNKAFCVAAHALSGGEAATAEGVRRAARAWLEANAGYWTSTTDFEQGCRGVVDAAAELGYEAWEIEALEDAWAEVGVFCPE